MNLPQSLIPAINQEPVNPLHQICQIAARNLLVAHEQWPQRDTGLRLAPWLDSFASEAFPVSADGVTLYDSVEFAGEAALYDYLNADSDLEILLTGAVVWQLRGIDAIARRKSDGVFILCEAKGSSRPVLASVLSYLPETKTKGRQFGWRWCWNSLLDMADHPATAAAFMALLQPMLMGRVERLLTISRVTRQDGAWRVAETQLYQEAQLQTFAVLAQVYALDKQRRMLREMASSPQAAGLLDCMADIADMSE